MTGDPGAPQTDMPPKLTSAEQPPSKRKDGGATPPGGSTPQAEGGLLNLSAVRRRARELGLQLSPEAVAVLDRWAADAIDGAALAARTGGRRRLTATFMRRVLFK